MCRKLSIYQIKGNGSPHARDARKIAKQNGKIRRQWSMGGNYLNEGRLKIPSHSEDCRELLSVNSAGSVRKLVCLFIPARREKRGSHGGHGGHGGFLKAFSP